MEATGVYWRSVYQHLEGLFPELWLCNAQHVKNVPGRKTDLGDAEWLSDVAAHGMVRPRGTPMSLNKSHIGRAPVPSPIGPIAEKY